MKIVLAVSNEFKAEPADLIDISENQRDLTVISAIKINNEWVIVSRFGDDTWQTGDRLKNIAKSHATIDFRKFPRSFRHAVKQCAYCYLMRGREGTRRPKGSSLARLLVSLLYFVKYLEKLNVTTFNQIPAIVFSNYVQECREAVRPNGLPIVKASVCSRLMAIEALYELSQHTTHALDCHPWPGTSAMELAQLTGANSRHKQKTSTPLIPDEIFCVLFEKAHQCIIDGDKLLDIRDALDCADHHLKSSKKEARDYERNKILLDHDYKNGMFAFKHDILTIRTACYILIASTSGCRNHELANIQSGAHHKTVEDDGETYHWMRSRSEKTYAGDCDWMIPSLSVRAIRLLERWAVPYQNLITREMISRSRINPLDPEIVEAKKHQHSLFLGSSPSKGHEARTLSIGSWNKKLKEFSNNLNLNWNISSHQFRKKFANYSAHSKFGDLRYLKEHFKHWSMDMSTSYAIDDMWGEHFDLDLLAEIESELSEIKQSVVTKLIADPNLSGGYGRSLKAWQRDPQNLAIFKDRTTMVKSIAESTAIRSNGHSWCTADDNACVGNTLERSRCMSCAHGVIGEDHIPIYRSLYSNLKSLLDCKDIGEAGVLRVQRDLNRYAVTLNDLGFDLGASID